MATVLSCLIFTTLLAAATTGSTSCPRGWISNDGSCYLFGHYPMPYNEAKGFCDQHSGQLVEVHNVGDNEFIKERLRMSPSKHWWIGLTDEATQGAWVWENSAGITNFTDWYPGQPNSKSEHCVIFAYNTGYQWADVPCTSSYTAICEKKGFTCIGSTEIVG